jgi:polyphosphate kinase 2 (PPK2 family)
MSADADAPRMKRKVYEKELGKLQVELCHLQEWVRANKLRVIVLFEGRDGEHEVGTFDRTAALDTVLRAHFV